MCTVSMVGDFYGDKFRQWPPQGPVIQPATFYPGQAVVVSPVGRDEFEQLRRDVADMKELLKRAKEYDERNHEPDCEVEEKMELLRKVAKLVGVDLNDVLASKPTDQGSSK